MRAGKRATIGLVVLALAASACNGVSRVDASANVAIEGVFQRVDGSPAADIPVAMAKELGPAEAFEAMWTVFSFGTLCLVSEPPDICRQRGAVTRTGGDGAYRLDVSGRDTQSFLGFASTLAVTGGLPPMEGALAGPNTTLRFAAQSEHVRLPTVRLWEAVPTVGEDAGAVTVQPPATPEWVGAPQSLSLQVESATGGTVWTQPAGAAVVRIDPRVLEDFASGVVVQADGRLSVTNLTADVAYRTAQAPVRGPGAAPSRGVSCTLHDLHGPTTVSPCPLTDGDLSTALHPSMPKGAPGEPPPPPPAPGEPAREESVVLDLGAAAPRSLVVLRGDPSEMDVDLSADGVTWTTPVRTQSHGPAAAVAVQGAARYVRLRTTMGMITRLVEVSVW